jgi:hypothetical protein
MEEALCLACQKDHAVSDLVEGMCATCRKQLGLLPHPVPELRPKDPCRRCGHEVIIQSLMRDRGATGSDYVWEFAVPLGATIGTKEKTGFFSGRKRLELEFEESTGIFVAYICEKCGFTEVYCNSPREIPIGPEYGTKILGL